jgi:hypothetical protein
MVRFHRVLKGGNLMKKFVALVLVGVLMFAALGMFTAGSASASGQSYAPLAAGATATPVLQPARLPPSGGEADLSGALLVIGLGSLLVIGGLALRTLRQPHA